MTIVHGEKWIVEGIGQFMERLDVTGKEVMLSEPPDRRKDIVEEFNGICDDYNEEPVESVSDLPEWVYEEWHEWYQEDAHTAIVNVLSRRRKKYVHLYDGTVHTIVEITNDRSGEIRCLDCGRHWKSSLKPGAESCPECGARGQERVP